MRKNTILQYVFILSFFGCNKNNPSTTQPDSFYTTPFGDTIKMIDKYEHGNQTLWAYELYRNGRPFHSGAIEEENINTLNKISK